MQAQLIMTKMLEHELRMQDEAFALTNIEQEDLEENLMFYMKDPAVAAKMQQLMAAIQAHGGGHGGF